jgi:hypothetical protein
MLPVLIELSTGLARAVASRAALKSLGGKMSNTQVYELQIILKADEPTLCEIHDSLTKARSDHPGLTHVLAAMVKETLLAAGIADNFEVELHLKEVDSQHIEKITSNALEWPENGASAHHFDKMFNRNR